MKNRIEHVENAAALLRVAENWRVEPMEAVRAISKIFGQIPTEKKRIEREPTKEEIAAREERQRQVDARIADPRFSLSLLMGFVRPDAFGEPHPDDAVPAMLTVEDASQGLAPVVPVVFAPVMSTPAPSPHDFCACRHRRALHESGGQCLGCGRCRMFVRAEDAAEQRHEARALTSDEKALLQDSPWRMWSGRFEH